HHESRCFQNRVFDVDRIDSTIFDDVIDGCHDTSFQQLTIHCAPGPIWARLGNTVAQETSLRIRRLLRSEKLARNSPSPCCCGAHDRSTDRLQHRILSPTGRRNTASPHRDREESQYPPWSRDPEDW